MTWTNRLILHKENEIIVEFNSTVKSFKKRYTVTVNKNDIESFLAEKLADIETLYSTYMSLQNYLNVEQSITDGWTFKIVQIAIPADWIELIIDVKSPSQTFSKMFSTRPGRDINFLNNFIVGEKNKLIAWIENEDTELLSAYFAQEVIL